VAHLVVDAEVDVGVLVLADVARVAALRAALELEDLLGLGKQEVPLAGPVRLLLAEDRRRGEESPRLRGLDLDEVPGAGPGGQVPR
jgi:hypothetical protein